MANERHEHDPACASTTPKTALPWRWRVRVVIIGRSHQTTKRSELAG
jgi:hypothetical protein